MALTGKDLIDIINGFQMSQVLVTASTLGVFEELHKHSHQPISAAAVAKSLRTDPDATARLLNSCAGLGLVEKKIDPNGEAVYRNVTATEKYLLKTSACSIAPLVAKMGDLYHIWGKLRQGVKDGKTNKLHNFGGPPNGMQNGMTNGVSNGMSNGVNNGLSNGMSNGMTNGMTNGFINGKTKELPNGVTNAGNNATSNGMTNGMINGTTNGVHTHGTNGAAPSQNGMTPNGISTNMFMNEEKALEFLKCMHIFSKMDSPHVTNAFDLSPFKTACDLGGATGGIAEDIASNNPDMAVTVFDLPMVIKAAPKFQKSPVKNLKFVSGDFFKDELPQADLYILSHVIHDWGDEKVDILLKKVYSRMRPGGALLVLEKTLNDDKVGPMSTLLFDLGMLMINEGRERTAQEYKTLLSSHGFQDIQVKVLEKSQYRDAILARKP